MAKASNPKKTANRKVRFDQFKKQLEEIDLSNLQEVELSATESVWLRLGNSLNCSEDEKQDWQRGLEDCETSEDVALYTLGFHPEGVSAEDQWALFEKAGGTADEYAALWTSLTRDQQERLGKVKAKRS